VGHATVVMNGRDLGVYVLVEGWNKQFLKRHFRDPGGNLYERTSDARDITGQLEVKSGDHPDDRRALDALVAAVEEPDLGKRWKELERTLDVERFLRSMALEIMLGHWDGYCRNQNNYRIFHDRVSDRLVFLPHGMDQLFGNRRNSPETSLIPQMRGVVAAAIMETGEGRRRYTARIEEMHTRFFNVEALTNRVMELSARLRPWLEDDPGMLRTNEVGIEKLLERIPRQYETIQWQIATLRKPMPPGQKDRLFARRWESKRDSGNPHFSTDERILQVTGQPTLTCIGWWQTVVLLEPGRYRFEGRVAVDQLRDGDFRPEGVAMLRTSENHDGPEASLPQTWTNLVHEFTVTETRHIDLICEYRGNSGRASFDADTLTLTRLDANARPKAASRREGL
jgi:hypothetical protein